MTAIVQSRIVLDNWFIGKHSDHKYTMSQSTHGHSRKFILPLIGCVTKPFVEPKKMHFCIVEKNEQPVFLCEQMLPNSLDILLPDSLE
mmetsp:Transcript_22815/g.23171  ORF Transcript_22815/g.23171 Transcript_22815/m.23171 type:complete len:88 (+) Transcript_22815:591-854(+)